jgi:DNA-binding NarL/FixJ family response regulator
MRTVILIEEHPIQFHGLEQLISDMEGAWQTTGCTAVELKDAAKTASADLILYSIPRFDLGLEKAMPLVRAMRTDKPTLLMCEDPADIAAWEPLPPHVRGSIPTASSVALIRAAMKLVLSGGQCFPQHRPDLPERAEHAAGEQAGEPVDPAEHERALLGLTKRQYDVLVHFSRGATIEDVGAAMKISLATARSHAHSLYKAMQVSGKTEAVFAAVALGATLSWVPTAQAMARGPASRPHYVDRPLNREFGYQQLSLF